MNKTTLEQGQGYWIGRFQAMASPCEVLIEVKEKSLARKLLDTAQAEAARIEQKFSRYLEANVTHCINNSAGKAVEVDTETAALLDYAAKCFEISDGLFDVTSGVLREIWRFDGGDHLPSQEQINSLLPRIGWNKLKWEQPKITVPKNMEIDFGGIGKEYAVDSSARLLREITDASVLINFGGDLCVTCPRENGEAWVVGVDNLVPVPTGSNNENLPLSTKPLLLGRGGIATSGDRHRYLTKDGIRYGHILNPKTGWPVLGAPHSVTVVADSCVEAGILSTLAMLQGAKAEEFLESQEVPYWIG